MRLFRVKTSTPVSTPTTIFFSQNDLNEAPFRIDSPSLRTRIVEMNKAGHVARVWRRGLPRLSPRLFLAPRFFSGSPPIHACQSAHGPACKKAREPNASSAAPRSLRSSWDPGFWTCKSTWKRAGINTLRCLVGCTIGDFSALWILQTHYPGLGMGMIMGASSKSCPSAVK